MFVQGSIVTVVVKNSVKSVINREQDVKKNEVQEFSGRDRRGQVMRMTR